MSALGNISDKLGVFDTMLTNEDTYPYDTTDIKPIYISISNEGTTTLELFVRYLDGSTGTIICPGSKPFSALVKEIAEIDVVQSSTFVMALFSRGVI